MVWAPRQYKNRICVGSAARNVAEFKLLQPSLSTTYVKAGAMSYSSYTPLPIADPDTPVEAEMDTLAHIDQVPGSPSNLDDDIDRNSTKSRLSAGDIVSGLVRFRAR